MGKAQHNGVVSMLGIRLNQQLSVASMTDVTFKHIILCRKDFNFFFFFLFSSRKKNVPVLSLQPLLCQNKQGVSFTWANYFNPFAYRVIRIYLVIYQCFFSFIYFVLSTFEFYTAQTSVNISRSHYTLWINNALFTLQCDRFIFLFNVHCGEPWILQHHRYLERYVLH